jgi:hypothetical protein
MRTVVWHRLHVHARIDSLKAWRSIREERMFAGSEPGLMNQLFGEPERPLFGQAVPMELRELPDDALGAHIEQRFAQTRRDPGEALDALLHLVRGHPQRAMLMAHYLWERTPAGSTATVAQWIDALDEVIDSLAEGFERFLDGLRPLQVRVLFALALSPHGLNSNYTQARFGLPRGAEREMHGTRSPSAARSSLIHSALPTRSCVTGCASGGSHPTPARPIDDQPSRLWRMTGCLAAATSSSRRTGVV